MCFVSRQSARRPVKFEIMGRIRMLWVVILDFRGYDSASGGAERKGVGRGAWGSFGSILLFALCCKLNSSAGLHVFLVFNLSGWKI